MWNVEIKGQFKGEIVSDGRVTLHSDTISDVSAKTLILIASTLTGDAVIGGGVQIDESSFVKGNIRASSVECSGTINGNIKAENYITLAHTAAVNGDIKTTTMEIANGAQVHGQIDMF